MRFRARIVRGSHPLGSLLAVMSLAGCHGTSPGNGLPAPTQTVSHPPAAPAPPECLRRDVSPVDPGGVSLRADQLGYLAGAEVSVALVGAQGPAGAVRVCDLSQGRYVGGTRVPALGLDTQSLAGTRLVVHTVTLPAGLHPGAYQVESTSGAVLGHVTVGDAVYAPVLPAVLSFMRTQRCGPTTEAVSGHGACHVYASVTDGNPATASGDGVAEADGARGLVSEHGGTAVDAEGGWHDAGDYVKFVGTTAFVLAVDLSALRDHPRAFGASREGLKSEMRWGLAWLDRMLGGTVRYHQVSGEFDHDAPPRVPEEDTHAPLRDDDGNVFLQRPVYRIDVGAGRGGNLLGRGAASFALAAQTLARTGEESTRWIALARTLYTAAVALPAVQNPDPPDFYPENAVLDDLALAAVELARATGERSYALEALHWLRRVMATDAAIDPEPYVFWGDVTALALVGAVPLFPEGSAERTELVADLRTLETPVQRTAARPLGPAGAYGYALPAMGNGSLAQSLGAAVGCLAAQRVGALTGCDTVARRQLHWLFGQNPFGLSFMVGVGAHWPHAVHHALSQATQREITGAVVGGPVTVTEFRHMDPDVAVPALRTGPLAALSTQEVFYEDVAADYVTNEPAIDFAAPLVWTLAELMDPAGVPVPPNGVP